MEYVTGIHKYEDVCRSAVTLGKFDGLHKGHQKLIQKVCAYAQKEGLKSIVFAFDMSPFYQNQTGLRKGLVTNEERRSLLEGKVDCLLECPFTKEISGMDAEEFIETVLVKKLHAGYIAVGTDFRFGYQKKGDFHMLKAYAEIYGYEVEVVEKERAYDRAISSTFIKEGLAKGDMELVRNLLGYPYAVRGTVVHGRQLGRTLGIPTMNIYPAKEKLLPPNGVYASRTAIGEKLYEGITNIGIKPTVDETSKILLETYLFEYEGDMYGKEIKVELYDFERPEQRFGSIEELKDRMEQDIETVKQYFKG